MSSARGHENHGVHAEIIDGQALSELLAAEDCLWIAERYLGVEVPGKPPGSAPRSERRADSLGEITGTGIQVGVVNGDISPDISQSAVYRLFKAAARNLRAASNGFR